MKVIVSGPRSGKIPNSVNIPFFEVLDTTRRAMCSVQELKDKFAAVNVDLNKPVVMSCVGGRWNLTLRKIAI